jgi:protein gp37
MIFVNSMSDLFHKDIPGSYIQAVANVMATANWHTYQVLTKRADRLRALLDSDLRTEAMLPNIWWGVSVEDRKHGFSRIDLLRDAPATVRFLSIEPLLEDLGEMNLEGIHWVIVGGESGHGARPMHPSWVESLRDQCQTAGIPFFFKQWGGVQKKKAGRTLNGLTYDEQPVRLPRSPLSKPERLNAIADLEHRVIKFASLQKCEDRKGSSGAMHGCSPR